MTSPYDAFELQFGLLQHKVLGKIGEENVDDIELSIAEVTTSTLDETLTTLG